ncbi:hypothetical protein D6833_09255 [Candidatus Parcubacteria bacterium]|nr:MAG: hypothetical protein D6833_09255 [Candidatus Parcubacteria bacterium]
MGWSTATGNAIDRSRRLACADGHVEHWRWLAPKDWSNKQSYWKRATDEKDLADLRRLQGVTLPVQVFWRQWRGY